MYTSVPRPFESGAESVPDVSVNWGSNAPARSTSMVPVMLVALLVFNVPTVAEDDGSSWCARMTKLALVGGVLSALLFCLTPSPAAFALKFATPGERSRLRQPRENSRGSANNRLQSTRWIWLASLAARCSTTPVSPQRDRTRSDSRWRFGRPVAV